MLSFFINYLSRGEKRLPAPLQRYCNKCPRERALRSAAEIAAR
jgi:hypothetical protein